MNQVLLTVDVIHNGNFVEITIFGHPRVQNRVKSVLLSLASRNRQHRARGEGLKTCMWREPRESHLAVPGFLPTSLTFLILFAVSQLQYASCSPWASLCERNPSKTLGE